MEPSERSFNNGKTERNFLYTPRTFTQKLLGFHRELPVPEKCCYCLPLRHGFLVLAYIKLVLSIMLFLGILYILLLILIFDIKEIFIQCVIWFALCLDLLDIIIGIFIIVSAYKKNKKLMEIYYRYSLYVFGLLIVPCAVIFHMMFTYIYALLILLLLFSLIMLMQVYLILMVRSEVLKLKSNAQFQFLNDEPEPLCTYINKVDN